MSKFSRGKKSFSFLLCFSLPERRRSLRGGQTNTANDLEYESIQYSTNFSFFMTLYARVQMGQEHQPGSNFVVRLRRLEMKWIFVRFSLHPKKFLVYGMKNERRENNTKMNKKTTLWNLWLGYRFFFVFYDFFF